MDEKNFTKKEAEIIKEILQLTDELKADTEKNTEQIKEIIQLAKEIKVDTNEEAEKVKEIIRLANKVKDKTEDINCNNITDHFYKKFEDEKRYKPELDEDDCYNCKKSDKCTEKSIENPADNYFNNLKSDFDALIKNFPDEPLFYIERARLNMSYYDCKHKSSEEKYNLCCNAVEDYEKAVMLTDKPSQELLFAKIELEAKLGLYDKVIKDYDRVKTLYGLKYDDFYYMFWFGLKDFNKFFPDYEKMITDEYNKNKFNKTFYYFDYYIEACLYRKEYKKVIEWTDKYIKAALLYFDELYNIDRNGIPFSEDNYNISIKGLKIDENPEDENGHHRSDLLTNSLEAVFMYRAIAKQNLKLYEEAIKDYINYCKLDSRFFCTDLDRSSTNELFKLYSNSHNRKEKTLKQIIKIRNKYLFNKFHLKKLKNYKIGIFWISEDENKIITANIKTVKDILKEYKTDVPDIFYPDLSYEKAWQALDKEKIIKAGGNPDKNGGQSLKHGYVAYDFIKEEFVFAGGKWLTSKLILTKLADIFGLKISYEDSLFFLEIKYRIKHIPEFDDIQKTDK